MKSYSPAIVSIASRICRSASASASFSRVSRSGKIDELDFGAGELAVGRHEVEAAGFATCDADIGDRSLRRAARDRRCACSARLSMPGARGRVALRIEIDDQHAPLHRDEAGGEIDGRRRLADAALLVRRPR